MDQQSPLEGWKNYPYNHCSYIEYRDPNAEFGCKTILDTKFTAQSRFTVHNVGKTTIRSKEFSGTPKDLESLLLENHDPLRIYVFRRNTYDQWILRGDDARKIFHRYQMQPTSKRF